MKELLKTVLENFWGKTLQEYLFRCIGKFLEVNFQKLIEKKSLEELQKE